MKEDKEIIERLGKEWGRFWITAGMEVYHREMIDPLFKPREEAFLMIVDQVVKRPVKVNGEKNQPFRIVGIQCHWFRNGEFQKGLFHTKELFPANIVDKDLLEDWLKR